MMKITCDKETFEQYKDGIERLTHLNSKRGRHKYKLYKCDHCGHYHITTITKNLRTPKKMEKYPIKYEPVVKRKEKQNPPQKKKQFAPDKYVINSAKMITPQQAAVLKQIIENGNK
jgi:hypothetical protein